MLDSWYTILPVLAFFFPMFILYLCVPAFHCVLTSLLTTQFLLYLPSIFISFSHFHPGANEFWMLSV